MHEIPARLRATVDDLRVRLDPRGFDRVRSAVVVAIVALSAFCLLWRLGVADWRVDEHLDGIAAQRAVGGDWAGLNGHPVFVRWFLGAGQVLFGDDRFAVRIGPALISLALVGLLLALGRRVAGFWAGAIAAGIWGLVPRPVMDSGREQFLIRPDRYAYLEPWSSFFLIAAIWAGWAWVRRGGWRLAAGCGALLGVGAAFKPTVLVAVPAIAAAAVVVRRDWWRTVAEAGVLAATSLAVAASTYAPLGSQAPHGLRALYEFQRDHLASGHFQVTGGSRTVQQAWTTNFHAQWAGSGPVLTTVLLVGAVLALCGRHRAVAAYLHLVLLVVVVAHAASPVALPHYHSLWFPLLALLAGIGFADVVADGARRARAVGVVAIAVLLVFAAVGVGRVATIQHGDMDHLVDRLAAEHIDPKTIVFAGEPVVPSFPRSTVSFFLPAPELPAKRPDLMVLDLHYARVMTARAVWQFREMALASGLRPHRVGDLEVWWA